MLDPRWLMRASMWVRNPPSMGRVKLVFAVVAIALVIFGIEWMGLWPDWATAERIPRKF
jgi:hypothetical protein